MAQVHFLKVNVNSSIHDVIDGTVGISIYLDKLYEVLDDNKEYKLKTGEFKNSNGEVVEIFDTYCFSELEKEHEENKRIITGKLVRRFNKTTEQYDPKKKISNEYKIPQNSASIIFYFDVNNEIITFIKRQSFGVKQFLSGFEGLINTCNVGTDFNLQFKQDPLSIKEHIEDAHKIIRLRTVNVMPNSLSSELEKFIDLNEKLMKDANANKLTIDYEGSQINKGINKESDIVKSIINRDPIDSKTYRGYEKVEFDAVDKDGYSYHYNSEKDSLLSTEVEDYMSKSIAALKAVSEKIIQRINIRSIQQSYKGKKNK